MELGARIGTMASAGGSGMFIVNGERMVGDLFTLYMNKQLTNAKIIDLDGAVTSLNNFSFANVVLDELRLPNLETTGSYFLYQGGGIRIFETSSKLTGVNSNVGIDTCINHITKTSNLLASQIVKHLVLDRATELGPTTVYDTSNCESIVAENVRSTSSANTALRNCYKMNLVRLGRLTNVGYYQEFVNLGRDADPDESGIKATINVGNTMDEFMALTRFPWSMPTTTKVVCADGYIVYENGAWTKHASSALVSTRGGVLNA